MNPTSRIATWTGESLRLRASAIRIRSFTC
jgi:hypothetical protein